MGADVSFSIVFEVQRKEALSDEEFVRLWLGHSDVAAELPGLRHYEILPVSGGDEGGPDGFVLMRFDSKEAADEAFASPQMAASAADSASFAAHFGTFYVDSHRIV
jgi:uncharacterized protein (TIGR02118 family)